MFRRKSKDSNEGKPEEGSLSSSANPNQKNFLAGTGGKIMRGAAAGIVGLGLFYNMCTTYVRPNESGIKQVEMSPFGLLGKKGIHEKVYDPGLHTVWPVFEKMHRFPRDIQVLHLHSGDDLTGDEQQYARVVDSAKIQTSDGFYIDLDASIIYNIQDPHQTITTLGAGNLYVENGVIPKAEPALKEALGIMNPEDFYNSSLRVKKQEVARDLLDKLLDPKGIKVDHILIRYPEYHPQVQERIEGRKLQDQLVYTNQSIAKEKTALADLQKVTEEGQAAKKVEIMSGTAYVTEKISQKEMYVRSKHAEADKLVNLANAKKTELVNAAYQGEGSEKLLGLKMADVLNGLDEVVVMTGGNQGFNPLDLESMLQSWNIKDEGVNSK